MRERTQHHKNISRVLGKKAIFIFRDRKERVSHSGLWAILCDRRITIEEKQNRR